MAARTIAKRKDLDWQKFKTVIHYICSKAEDPTCLGAVKLNKVLWYSDVSNFLATGKPITGATYVKREHGPVPRDVRRALDALSKENKIAPGKVNHFGFIKHEFISLAKPDVNLLSAEEVQWINAAFEHVCFNHTATSVSKETHNVIWDLAEMGEEMPYYTVFAVDTGEIDEKDLKWAKAQLRRIAA